MHAEGGRAGREGAPRSAFVTGAYGLLGTWLVKALLERGDRVTVLRRDRQPVSALGLFGLEEQVAVVDGDVCDAAVLDRALGEYEVDTVFHLAAQTLVPTANRSPVPTFDVNMRGTWTVMEAVRRHEVARTIVASSDKAYGSHTQLPYREDFALQPRYPYDVSKAATDLIARSYWHTFGVPVAVTRFANLYGGGDLNRSRLVPEVVGAVLAGRRPVIRSDGTPERDFLHAQDAAAAYLAIADALDSDGARGEAFNAGGGRPVPVGQVVRMVCELAGSDLEPDVQGAGTPSGEIDRQYVDTTKISEVCGWAPTIDLESGLRQTIDWYREHREVVSAR
jgi:CDP-glucose 4,6-dehydratase